MPTTSVRRLISPLTRSSGLVTGMRVSRCRCSAAIFKIAAYGAIIGTEAPGARRCGQADAFDEPRARVSSWPPLRLARLRWERESVVVVSPVAPVLWSDWQEVRMRRAIGIEVHRTLGEVVFWEDGKLRHAGRVDMT